LKKRRKKIFNKKESEQKKERRENIGNKKTREIEIISPRKERNKCGQKVLK